MCAAREALPALVLAPCVPAAYPRLALMAICRSASSAVSTAARLPAAANRDAASAAAICSSSDGPMLGAPAAAARCGLDDVREMLPPPRWAAVRRSSTIACPRACFFATVESVLAAFACKLRY